MCQKEKNNFEKTQYRDSQTVSFDEAHIGEEQLNEDLTAILIEKGLEKVVNFLNEKGMTAERDEFNNVGNVTDGQTSPVDSNANTHHINVVQARDSAQSETDIKSELLNPNRSNIDTPEWVPGSPFAPRTLIMKGGGVKGIAYVGALEILETYGYKFNHFVGTSAGAITAALLAVGYTTEELKTILGETNFKEFKDRWLLPAILLLPLRKGLYKGSKFTKWLKPLLKKKFPSLPDVSICFGHIPKEKRLTVFTSIKDRSFYEFDSKKTRESGGKFTESITFACRCSMAIPYFFEPEKINGEWAVDGGAQNNYPVYALRNYFTRIKEEPADFLGLYLGEKEVESRIKLMFSNLMFSNLLSIVSEAHDVEAKDIFIDRTIVIYPDPVSTTDFSLTRKEIEFLIAEGRRAALSWLLHWADGQRPDQAELQAAEELSEGLRKEVTKERSKRFWKKSIIFLILFFVVLGTGYGIYTYYSKPPIPPPSLPDGAWAIAVESDSNLDDAKEHLKNIAIRNKYLNAYIFYRRTESESERYRTVIIFSSEDEAKQNFPKVKEIKPEITDVKEISKWCPKPAWANELFLCTIFPPKINATRDQTANSPDITNRIVMIVVIFKIDDDKDSWITGDIRIINKTTNEILSETTIGAEPWEVGETKYFAMPLRTTTLVNQCDQLIIEISKKGAYHEWEADVEVQAETSNGQVLLTDIIYNKRINFAREEGESNIGISCKQ